MVGGLVVTRMKAGTMAKRVGTIVVLLPIVIISVWVGTWTTTILVAIFTGLAAWEYARLFKTGKYSQSTALIITGSLALVFARQLWSFPGSDAVLALLIMVFMIYHTFTYQRGVDTAALDFGISLAGVVYLGWMMSYFISLRSLPDGFWWIALAFLASMFSDMGAFLIGSRFGKHKMMTLVSPNKSWEGYLGGVVVSILLTALIAWVVHFLIPAVTLQAGLWMGLVISILAPLGDFGESMLKRPFGIKDSSNLIPGHGGFLDRIDAFLWAAVLGYYLTLMLT
jgi:phosphatidate cytidylyltransferase